ncbi:hypothetical protein C8Q74DRAFT_1292462 [Fomes fomentarius]|nr:hypothetical protein C8Q74DRAFT_1292462 [Fomes fomentarius]
MLVFLLQAISTSHISSAKMPGNPGNVARGLKAAMNNDNNSEETKADAERRLNEMHERGEVDSQEAHDGQVLRGHKSAVANPNNSEETKQNSRKMVEDLEGDV